jgi:hypothetical protein
LLNKFGYNTFFKIYGISQNPNTNDYILVQDNLGFINWMSGNKKIDDFIENMQLKIKEYNDIIIEWIPYNQFTEIKEIGKGGFSTICSAIWKDGPLHYNVYLEKYRRDPNKVVALKYLNDSKNLINELLNEV